MRRAPVCGLLIGLLVLLAMVAGSLSTPATPASAAPLPQATATPAPTATPTPGNSIINQITNITRHIIQFQYDTMTNAVLNMTGKIEKEAYGAASAPFSAALDILVFGEFGLAPRGVNGELPIFGDLILQSWQVTLTLAMLLMPLTLVLVAVNALRQGVGSALSYADLKEALIGWFIAVGTAVASYYLISLLFQLSTACASAVANSDFGEGALTAQELTKALFNHMLFPDTNSLMVTVVIGGLGLFIACAVVLGLMLALAAFTALAYMLTTLAPIVLVLGTLPPLEWLRSMWLKVIIIVSLLPVVDILLLKATEMLAYRMARGDIRNDVGVVLGSIVLGAGVLSVLIGINFKVAETTFGALGEVMQKAWDTAMGVGAMVAAAATFAVGAAALGVGAVGAAGAGAVADGGAAAAGASGAAGASAGGAGGSATAGVSAGGAAGGGGRPALGSGAVSGNANVAARAQGVTPADVKAQMGGANGGGGRHAPAAAGAPEAAASSGGGGGDGAGQLATPRLATALSGDDHSGASGTLTTSKADAGGPANGSAQAGLGARIPAALRGAVAGSLDDSGQTAAARGGATVLPSGNGQAGLGAGIPSAFRAGAAVPPNGGGQADLGAGTPAASKAGAAVPPNGSGQAGGISMGVSAASRTSAAVPPNGGGQAGLGAGTPVGAKAASAASLNNIGGQLAGGTSTPRAGAAEPPNGNGQMGAAAGASAATWPAPDALFSASGQTAGAAAVPGTGAGAFPGDSQAGDGANASAASLAGANAAPGNLDGLTAGAADLPGTEAGALPGDSQAGDAANASATALAGDNAAPNSLEGQTAGVQTGSPGSAAAPARDDRGPAFAGSSTLSAPAYPLEAANQARYAQLASSFGNILSRMDNPLLHGVGMGLQGAGAVASAQAGMALDQHRAASEGFGEARFAERQAGQAQRAEQIQFDRAGYEAERAARAATNAEEQASRQQSALYTGFDHWAARTTDNYPAEAMTVDRPVPEIMGGALKRALADEGLAVRNSDVDQVVQQSYGAWLAAGRPGGIAAQREMWTAMADSENADSPLTFIPAMQGFAAKAGFELGPEFARAVNEMHARSENIV